MTPKQLLDLAAHLYTSKPSVAGFASAAAYHAAYNMWADSVAGISTVCEQTNINFDRLRFLKVCTQGASA